MRYHPKGNANIYPMLYSFCTVTFKEKILNLIHFAERKKFYYRFS